MNVVWATRGDACGRTSRMCVFLSGNDGEMLGSEDRLIQMQRSIAVRVGAVEA